MRLPLPLLCATALILAAPSAHAADPGAADRGVAQPRPGFRDALTSPLEDLNLKKTDVPDVLVRAMAAPYATEGLDRCEPIAAEIGRLNGVLGPDMEEAPPPDTRSRTGKIAGEVHDGAVQVIQDETRSVLPFRSWLRKLTGAERNSRRMAAAARAGDIRRGYLKGVGMRMNCAPPAAPSWFVPVVAKPAAPPAPPTPVWRRWLADLMAWLRGVIAAAVNLVR